MAVNSKYLKTYFLFSTGPQTSDLISSTVHIIRNVSTPLRFLPDSPTEISELLLPTAGGVPVGALGLLRGVRDGWMGRMPDIGWDCACPALGRCRGAIEVSVVGTGSVSLMRKQKQKYTLKRSRAK